MLDVDKIIFEWSKLKQLGKIGVGTYLTYSNLKLINTYFSQFFL